MFRRALIRLAFGALCVAVATALRFGLGQIWPDLLTFPTYFPAVLIATLACGVEAGITATLLGALAGWWLFVEPAYQFFPIKPTAAVGIFLYLISSAIIVWAAERYRALVQRLRDEVNERERLKKQSDRLAVLVAQSPDAIISCAASGTIETWNAGAERLFGYSEAEAIGRSLDILVPDGKRGKFNAVLSRLQSGESVTLLAKRREPIAVEIAAGPVRDTDGQVIGLCAAVHDIRERVQHQEQMEIVMHELSHRAKNLLAVVSAVASQMAQRSEGLDDFQTRFNDRLQALAASHDALVEKNWTGVPIAELIRAQLAPFHELDGVRVTASGPEIILNPKPAEQIGLCLHELATNAVKYGSLSVPAGTVAIEWAVDADNAHERCFRLTWRERGGPRVENVPRLGFGSLVLQRLVPAALSGEASKDFAPEGITWKLSCPAVHALKAA